MKNNRIYLSPPHMGEKERKYLSDAFDSNWIAVDKADVYYLSPKSQSLSSLTKFFRNNEYNIIYLNSFFATQFTIKPLILRWLKMIPNKPIVIAPRGEFSPGAIGLKNFKKRVFIIVVRILGLYSGIIWQASSRYEASNIRYWFGKNIELVVAPNLSQQAKKGDCSISRFEKNENYLKIIFLSRISPKKNIDFALERIRNIKGQVQFNIYGPIEDIVYWNNCQKIIKDLPTNINVQYCGSVKHSQVTTLFKTHDLFFFPTLGENFGHVILEALCAGCPVLISDQTPWQNMAKTHAGWDLPLDQPGLFTNVIQQCLKMNNDEYLKWSKSAMRYGFKVTNDGDVVEQNRKLFYNSLNLENNYG